jgi:Lrp/AsnC family transcriptional regulator, leucine-responsive regulatory protein
VDRIDLDQKILAMLERNGRATHADIGRELGITGPAVFARVRRMEESGLIRGYRADIDPSKMGQPLTAFVRVTTRPIKVETDSFEPFVWSESRIVECHDVAAEDTFILKVRCASPEDLRDLLMCIRARPQVIRTASSVALAIVKEPGMTKPDYS